MKKINEDIKPVETDNVDLPPEEIYDYMSQSFIGTDDAEHRFYIIWDIREIEKLLGTEGEREMTEWLFDKWFGEYNWGYEDDWYIDYLRNNTEECNQFLSDSTMRSLGWYDFDSSDGYWGWSDDRSPNAIYDILRERFPTPGPDGVDFIFDWIGGYQYKVWADKDLSDYVDEEGESDEQ